MENNKQENPFVFPWASSSDSGHVGQAGFNEGITLRDYLAAKAMQGIMANGYKLTGKNLNENEVVGKSYEVADAMLKERSK